METGWTEEERSTVGTDVRGEPEEGKRKDGRLSSQNRAEADERKWNGRPRESWKRKWKTGVSRKEAAAEIEADGRRKEIADEAIR